MKFLITGGSGFLGHDVADRLVKDGHSVVLFGRSQNQRTAPGQEFFKGDITNVTDLASCKQAHPDISSVVHLAALVPKNKDEDIAEDMERVNVQGTINLLEVFGRQTKSLIYASTAEVYGLPTSKHTISETDPVVPSSNYGKSKLAGELVCRAYEDKYGLKVCVLRFTVLYGPGDTINRAIPNFIRNALAGKDVEVYGGEELRDYLHVADAARAVHKAATQPVSGVFNIGTGKGISIKDTAEKIIAASGSKSKLVVLSRRKDPSDIVLDVTKARQELGFEATYKFPDLLGDQIKWQKNQQ